MKALALLLLLVAAPAFAQTPTQNAAPSWGPACTEWHASPDSLYPMAIWLSSVYPSGQCFGDRNWAPCNPKPDTIVTLDLTQMGVAVDAKIAVFQGTSVLSSSNKVGNTSMLSIQFCAPGYACDFTRPPQYTIGQGGRYNNGSGVTGIEARAPVTVFAPVEQGRVKYLWHYSTTSGTKPDDENYGMDLPLVAWCR
jgi:hypothetical protein